LPDKGKKQISFDFCREIPNMPFAVAVISKRPDTGSFLLLPKRMQKRISKSEEKKTKIQVQSILL
jgi:hypothetical protein